jgi:hypothetical protein|tara:strand:- start:8831 stop:9076 length:246 start_codon:yes stop_codon:yes gene_type:complete
MTDISMVVRGKVPYGSMTGDQAVAAAIRELAFRLTEEYCRCMFGEDGYLIEDDGQIDCDCTVQWMLLIEDAVAVGNDEMSP